MAKSNITQQPISLLRTAVATLFAHPAILVPFGILSCIHLFFVEIMFFAPRYPLSKFFSPFILYWHGEGYLHYPFNFIVLVKWYHHWAVQFSFHVIFNCFFIGAAIAIIDSINNETPFKYRKMFSRAMSSYVHLFVAALINVSAMFGLLTVYSLAIKRALLIRSTSGIFFLLKEVVLKGAPYFQLLITVIVTTIFAFVMPIIIIERKKILHAFFLNFKYLWKSFWVIFTIMFLPTFLYVPLHLLKTNVSLFKDFFAPEMSGIFIILSIFLILFIDAVQFTAITIYYLMKKEAK